MDKRHILRKHRDVSGSASASASKAPPVGGMHRCPHCAAGYTGAGYLARHIAIKHKPEETKIHASGCIGEPFAGLPHERQPK